MKLHLIACAALLAASPLASTFAAEPGLGADNTHEATQTKDGSATNTLGSGYAATAPAPMAQAPMTSMPMAAAPTGSGVVPGDNSTVRGDSKATRMQRKEGVATGDTQ